MATMSLATNLPQILVIDETNLIKEDHVTTTSEDNSTSERSESPADDMDFFGISTDLVDSPQLSSSEMTPALPVANNHLRLTPSLGPLKHDDAGNFHKFALGDTSFGVLLPAIHLEKHRSGIELSLDSIKSERSASTNQSLSSTSQTSNPNSVFSTFSSTISSSKAEVTSSSKTAQSSNNDTSQLEVKLEKDRPGGIIMATSPVHAFAIAATRFGTGMAMVSLSTPPLRAVDDHPFDDEFSLASSSSSNVSIKLHAHLNSNSNGRHADAGSVSDNDAEYSDGSLTSSQREADNKASGANGTLVGEDVQPLSRSYLLAVARQNRLKQQAEQEKVDQARAEQKHRQKQRAGSSKLRLVSSHHSKSGNSCHQCKSSRTKIVYCGNVPVNLQHTDHTATGTLNGQSTDAPPPPTSGFRRAQQCRKRYCEQCLFKFYKQKAANLIKKWICPACRGVCCCAACRRNKEKHVLIGKAMLSNEKVDAKATKVAASSHHSSSAPILQQIHQSSTVALSATPVSMKKQPSHQPNLHQKHDYDAQPLIGGQFESSALTNDLNSNPRPDLSKLGMGIDISTIKMDANFAVNSSHGIKTEVGTVPTEPVKPPKRCRNVVIGNPYAKNFHTQSKRSKTGHSNASKEAPQNAKPQNSIVVKTPLVHPVNDTTTAL